MYFALIAVKTIFMLTPFEIRKGAIVSLVCSTENAITPFISFLRALHFELSP